MRSRKCVIEGAFTINKFSLEPLFAEEDLDYDPICILRREVSPQWQVAGIYQ